MIEVIQRNAAKAAALYKRRCWWASYEDMVQEATTAQLEAEARGTFDETFGRPRSAYLWTVAMYAVRRLVHKASAPVSTSHRTENLLGLYRTPVELEGEDGGVYENPSLTEDTRSTESSLVAQDRARRVRARVVELVGAQSAEFAFTVMTHEWRPNEVAEANDVPIKVVYAAQRRIATALIEDRKLYELWKESNE